MDSQAELDTLVLAYADAEDGAPPLVWTPAHVEVRLVEAFRIVTKTAGRVGPKGAQGFWPELYREFADYVAYDHKTYLKDRRAEIEREAGRLFSSAELSRADEAINWASRYLADSPLQADAIQFWAFCKATHAPIEKRLRARAVRADKLRAVRVGDADKRHAKHIEELRKRVADRWGAWAKARLETVPPPPLKIAARIRLGGQEKCRMEIAELEKKHPKPSKTLSRAAVMPGKVFTVRWLDVNRKAGAALLAERLHGDGVRVR